MTVVPNQFSPFAEADAAAQAVSSGVPSDARAE